MARGSAKHRSMSVIRSLLDFRRMGYRPLAGAVPAKLADVCWIIVALTSATMATSANPERCRETLASYNQIVAAIYAAARDYERCVTASMARDDCGAEFIEL